MSLFRLVIFAKGYYKMISYVFIMRYFVMPTQLQLAARIHPLKLRNVLMPESFLIFLLQLSYKNIP